MEIKRPLYLTSFFRAILIPLLLWVAFTPFSGWLDIKLSHFFFEKEAFSNFAAWNYLFHYGVLPAWILTFLAVGCLALSFFPSYRRWRNPCIVVLLTFAIGSGLVVHATLKDHWGRPRPKQVTEFGGQQNFRPYYYPNLFDQPEPSKSFSCGHCSTGFTFFSLGLLGTTYRSRVFWWLGWSLAWSLGILLSVSRIAQGGHFLSDTLASALIMWMTAWSLNYLFIIHQGSKHERINT